MENENNNFGKDSSMIAKQAEELYSDGKYAESFALFNTAADNGDTHSLCRVGQMYMNGKGVDMDLRKAFNTFKKSATDNNVESRFELGRCYFDGIGTTVNVEKGYELILSAAEDGFAPAQNYIGAIHINGDHVKKDVAYGKKWIKKSASQGFPKAVYNESDFYLHGEERDLLKHNDKVLQSANGKYPEAMTEMGLNLVIGWHTKKDPEAGMKMLKAASEEGHHYADAVLGEIYYNGTDMPANIELAKKHLSKAAEAGDVKSMFLLGCIFDKEDDPNSPDEAEYWFQEAAEAGDRDALYRLGRMYYFGHAVEKDYTKAFQLFLSAAEKGHDGSVYYVGKMYARGLGTVKDYDLAMKWLNRETDEFCEDKYYEIALIYSDPEYLYSNNKDMLRYLRWAASMGQAAAMYKLADYYEHNKEKRSMSDAIYWYLRSADEDYPPAMLIVAGHYLSGAYLPQSAEKAMEIYQRLYDKKGDPEAAANLAMAYEEGIYCEKNLGLARELYLEAAGKENAFAMLRLSRMSEAESDTDRAIFWLRGAAALDIKEACVELASRYENGNGVTKSARRAMLWYHKAFELGDKPSFEKFENLLMHIDENDEENEMEMLKRTAGENRDEDSIIRLAELSEDPEEKRAWYELAYELGGNFDAFAWIIEHSERKVKTEQKKLEIE